MTSYSQKLSSDYVRTYRTMLQNLSRPRIMPKDAVASKVYLPTSTVNTVDATPVFFPLFYAGEKGALGIWDKRTGVGAIKRRLDDDDRTYHVLELSNPRTNLGTYIATPKSALNALHITLPHLVMAMKNYRRNFAFEVLIMDSNAYRRRFSFATWYNPSALKKFSFLCQVPLRLEIGWNEIHVDFNELVRSTYKTSYVETIRIQIYANCKLRQIFFCDDRIIKGEIPIPSMRDFSNIRIIPLDYGPRTHPDGIEPGPEKKRNVPYVDPPAQIPPTRLEQDVKSLQRRRYAEVSKQRLMLQPYKTYFRDLLQEEKQQKKKAIATEAALKEAAAKASRSKTEEETEVGDSNLSEMLANSFFNTKSESPLLSFDFPNPTIREPPAPSLSGKLPTIKEEKEIKVMKPISPPTPKEKELKGAVEEKAAEKANLKNNNILPMKDVSRARRGRSDLDDAVTPSATASVVSSTVEPSLFPLRNNSDKSHPIKSPPATAKSK